MLKLITLISLLTFSVLICNCQNHKSEVTKSDIVGLWVDTSEIRLFDTNFRWQNTPLPLKPENITVYLANNGKCRLYNWALHLGNKYSVTDTTWTEYRHQSFRIDFSKYVFDSVNQRVHITLDSSLLYKPSSDNPYLPRNKYRITGWTYPSKLKDSSIYLQLVDLKILYSNKILVNITPEMMPGLARDFSKFRHP